MPTKVGELATTVHVAGKSGSATAAARLTYDETNAVTSVTDTITYSNLVAGATYTVTGTIVEVDVDGKIINPSVATNTIYAVAEEGTGTWTMNFDNVTLKPFAKYVVFESAFTAGGEDENATADSPIIHENIKDSAQTILTEDENGKTYDDVEEGPDESQGSENDEEKMNDENSSKRKSENEENVNNGVIRSGSTSPSTGDSSNAGLYITLAAAAAGIAATTVVLSRRKKGSEK